MRTATLVFELLLLALVGYVIFTAVPLRTISRLVPLVIGVPTAALLVYALAGEWFPKLVRGFNVSIEDFVSRKNVGGVTDSPREETQGQGAKEVKLVVQAVFWMALFFVLIFFVGFLFSIPIFMLAYLLVATRLVWWRAALTAAVVMGIVWGAFIKAVGISVFEGRLFDAFIPPI